jgi:hypothetical protein
VSTESAIEIPKELYFLQGDINKSVEWYLMTSYLYYIRDVSLILDHHYDKLCKFMYDNWKHIKHKYKSYILKEALVSGTGFYLKKEDYPAEIVTAACHIAVERGWL